MSTTYSSPLPFELIPLARIHEPPHQLRESIEQDQLYELADSLASQGLHQPIGVHGPDAAGEYVLAWGHRRLLAARLLRWDSIPAKLVPPDLDAVEVAITENLQRVDLTPMEEAHAVAQLAARGDSRSIIARKLRKSPGWVENRLALLNVQADIQAALHRRLLAIGTAQVLAAVDDDRYRGELLAEAVRQGISRETALVWVAEYQRDKHRILANNLAVDEIIRKSQEEAIYTHCESCARRVQWKHTHTFRVCAQCRATIQHELEAPPQEATGGG